MVNEKKQSTRSKKIIFSVASISAVVAVIIIGYMMLSSIKNNKVVNDDGTSQEQFEGTPEISSNLQQECQQSAVKLTTLKNIKDIEDEFKSHAANCREVYFSIDFLTPFRKEGMYPDLAVDIAHQILKLDKAKAHEILEFAKALKPWEFYLGPVSCDSQHVLDAYLESLDLPEDKVCFKKTDYKLKLFPELQSKNFEIFRKMLSNEEAVWMGQPESDVGCPEKISSVIDIVKKLAEGTVTTEEVKQDTDEQADFSVVIKNKETEKVTLVFRSESDCLQLRSVLVPSLEVSE
ncbi:MAG: hypothetical protein WA160_07575 [Pseudobdellovibrio sp.]